MHFMYRFGEGVVPSSEFRVGEEGLSSEFRFTPQGVRRPHASVGEIEMRSCFSSINEL